MFTLLAQAAPTGNTDLQWVAILLNSGPFAIVVYLILANKLITPGERDRLIQERQASQAREEKLNDFIRTEIVPLMTRSTEAAARNTEVLERALKILEEGGAVKEGG